MEGFLQYLILITDLMGFPVRFFFFLLFLIIDVLPQKTGGKLGRTLLLLAPKDESFSALLLLFLPLSLPSSFPSPFQLIGTDVDFARAP